MIQYSQRHKILQYLGCWSLPGRSFSFKSDGGRFSVYMQWITEYFGLVTAESEELVTASFQRTGK